MRIQEIDKNFSAKSVAISGDEAIYTIPHESFDLYGVFYDEKNGCFSRLHEEIGKDLRPHLFWLGRCTAGGRLRFSTDSEYFGLEVAYDQISPMSHMPLSGSCGITLLLENEDGTTVRMASFRPDSKGCESGYVGSARLPSGKMRNYILHFPLYNHVNSLKITLSAKARVDHGKSYKSIAPILYYGSSITQGGCASRPDNAYQGLISKWNNVDFINLGFSGNAKAEEEMVDYLSTLDCSLFVCDYDHNASDVEYLEKTHYRLYERYRAVRKNTPILFLTRTDLFQAERKELLPSDEKFNVNRQVDMKNSLARKEVVYKTYLRAKSLGDDRVYFLDGEELFGTNDVDNCTVDGCHPNDLGFYRMAEGIYKKMKEMDEVFESDEK